MKKWHIYRSEKRSGREEKNEKYMTRREMGGINKADKADLARFRQSTLTFSFMGQLYKKRARSALFAL